MENHNISPKSNVAASYKILFAVLVFLFFFIFMHLYFDYTLFYFNYK